MWQFSMIVKTKYVIKQKFKRHLNYTSGEDNEKEFVAMWKELFRAWTNSYKLLSQRL